MKKRWLCLILLLLCIGPKEAWAMQSVLVETADFAITLNGVEIDNVHRAYPFLLYQGVTYFPLAYNDCRFMGLETSWTKETGLSIARTDVSASYKETKGTNSYQQQAQVVEVPITIAGKKASGTEYPFLRFREVAYLPLTSYYCNEVLGWDSHYDEKTLVITSHNPQIHQIALKNGKPSNIFMLTEDRLWVQDGQEVVHMPLAAPEKRVIMLTLPIMQAAWGTHIQKGDFTQIGEERYYELYNYNELDIMRERHRLRAEGKWEDIPHNTYQFGDYLVTIQTVDRMVTGNLSIQKIGEKQSMAASSQYHYYNGENNESLNINCYDNKLYLSAIDPTNPRGTVICCVDLATGETSVVNHGIGQFLDGAMLYYEGYDDQTEQGEHYCYDLHNGQLTRLALANVYENSMDISPFAVLRNQIYYTGLEERFWLSEKDVPEAEQEAFRQEKYMAYHNGDTDLYRFGEEQTLNPGGRVRNLETVNSYVCAVFEPRVTAPAAPYQLMVFDDTGRVVFKTTDTVKKAMIAGSFVAYVNGETPVVYWAKLK